MRIIFLTFFSLSIFVNTSAQSKDKTETKPHLNISATIHTDIIYDVKQMDPDWFAGFRPSKIPIYPSDPGWGTDGHTYFSLQQSTFKFDGILPIDHKWDKIVLHVTFDLYGTGLHAGETTPRFRTGYGKWGPFLIGKEWSTFVDLNAFPNHWDWWGPSGMALMSSPMFRYTNNLNSNNKLELAIEVPGSDIDPGQLRQIDPALINFRTKEILPDLITRYTYGNSWGYIKGALLLRQLSYEVISQQLEQADAKHKFGWGLNITSNINLFKEHGVLKLQTVFGNGYAGYNNDGGVEITPDIDYNATVPFHHGFVVAYDHSFSNRLSASVTYSETRQDNSAGQADEAFHRSQYFISQVIFHVIKNTLMVGCNYQWGALHNKVLDSANDHRVVFSARYQLKYEH